MLILILIFPKSVWAETVVYKDLPARSNIDTSKEWSVNFNLSLDKSTVNSNNIIVLDSKGSSIPITVLPGKTDNTVLVEPSVSGYVPGNTYSLILQTGVKAKSGLNLKQPIRMKFTTVASYSNCSNFNGLPQIQSAEFDSRPLISGKVQNLNLVANVSSKVQYRVFTYKYLDSKYEEITNGYSLPTDGNSSYKVNFLKTLASTEMDQGIKYKIIVYVKNGGTTGTHQDKLTDYDNYYVDYVKCVSSIDNRNVTNYSTNNTLKNAIAAQLSGGKTDEGSSDIQWVTANSNQIKYYLDPSNFLDGYGKYQFMKLNYVDGISADVLNDVLKGKGMLEGKGALFIQAGKTYDINPVYLLSHALLETGNGQSSLSQGILVSSVNGQAVTPKTTYNFFGINAIDSDALREGSEYAYTQGWFTPDAAIIGGAKFVSEDYINNSSGMQNTLYKMRWNYNSLGTTPVHQYATDIGWAYKQIANIKSILDKCTNVTFTFEVPSYN